MAHRSDVQLVLLPPIGGDARVYYPQRALPFNLITPAPPQFERGDTLAACVKRYHAHLLSSGIVRADRPVVWGGLSLGGAMAQELARIHPPVALVLLGSFASAQELNPIVRAVGKTAHWIPNIELKIAELFAPIVMRMLSYMPASDVALCAQMYREYDKTSFKHGYRALSRWEGCAISAPVLRIHGTKDPIIPIARTTGVTHALDTMHIVTLGDRDNVNSIITEFLTVHTETSPLP